jgi:hypothetical protein
VQQKSTAELRIAKFPDFQNLEKMGQGGKGGGGEKEVKKP